MQYDGCMAKHPSAIAGGGVDGTRRLRKVGVGTFAIVIP